MEAGSTPLKAIHLRDYEPVAPDVLKRLPIGLIRQRLVVPVAMVNGVLIAAMPGSASLLKPQALEMVAHCPVELVTAPVEEILAFIREKLNIEPPSSESATSVTTAPSSARSPDLKGPLTLLVPEPPAVTMPPSSTTASLSSVEPDFTMEGPTALVRVLRHAVRNNASDIVITREGGRAPQIRQRIRGVLVSDWQSAWTPAETEEVFAFLGTQGAPHSDGSLRWIEHHCSVEAKDDARPSIRFDFLLSETKRFSSLTIALRRAEECAFSPESWGMSPNQAKILEGFMARSAGVLIFCGGEHEEVARHSAATARSLVGAERHMIQVSKDIQPGLTGVEQLASDGDMERFVRFSALAFRHAPDAVLIDSLDIPEVADLVFNEAAKGCFVIARMSARDTADAVAQLAGMGFEPYRIGATLLGVIAERNLRLLCARCLERETISREAMKELGISSAMQPAYFQKASGCDGCLKTGYDRQTTLFEVLEMTEEIRHRLTRDIKPEGVRSLLRSGGFMSFRQAALHKAINGQTSLAEVLRATA